ncbi:MAG: NTP transferase domain-containing protein [Phycisphaeraceae bacterium]
MNPSAAQSAPAAIVLAAGKGTRMGGDLPKVVYEVCGRPMVCWVVDACRAAGVSRCAVVVGYRGELVREALVEERNKPGMTIEFVEQAEQLGTGHAALMAEPVFRSDGDGDEGDEGDEIDTFVLNGDGPLIRASTLNKLLDTHRREQAHGTVATSVLEDPTGYGRVIRDEGGSLLEIVEQKDATPEQLAVREVNPNYLCYRASVLFDAIRKVGSDNAQGEMYLTDVPRVLRAEGKRVAVVDAVPAEDVLGVNTPEQREQVHAILSQRLEQEPHA